MRLLSAIMAISVGLVFGSLSIMSAADEKKPTAQQEKMKACNAEAGDKMGDERKVFMSNCLKAGAPASPMTRQDKMKKCNTDASAEALKGDERLPQSRQEVLADSLRARVRSPRLAVHSPGPS